jgi:hypothetical protein
LRKGFPKIPQFIDILTNIAVKKAGMIPIIAPLSVVERYSPAFKEVFTPQESKQFWRYVCGLLINENKTVEAINRLFVDDPMDQSTLNRFLTDSGFELGRLNEVRLDFLQSAPDTAFKQGGGGTSGVLILDDTLLQHYGPKKEDAAWLRDPHDKSYHWSHNVVNLHYSDDSTDYPVDFRLWEPADLGRLEAEFKAKGFTIPEQIERRKKDEPKKWREYLLKKYNKARSQPPKGKEGIETVYKTPKPCSIIRRVKTYSRQQPCRVRYCGPRNHVPL